MNKSLTSPLNPPKQIKLDLYFSFSGLTDCKPSDVVNTFILNPLINIHPNMPSLTP